MSYRHLRLKKIREDARIVAYELTSPDFSGHAIWEDFGIIELDLQVNSFQHKKNFRWEKHKIYPISLFALPPEERKKMVSKEYKDYSSGMWSKSVFHFITTCFENRKFPEIKEITA